MKNIQIWQCRWSLVNGSTTARVTDIQCGRCGVAAFPRSWYCLSGCDLFIDTGNGEFGFDFQRTVVTTVSACSDNMVRP